ncbi:helix-turn-helix domain-containing protein [Micromonospora sp. ATCC 39149]|uniref:MarR family transcriptional regulator n=1 Tax=Micromonospora sp. (strain ATCC 39149 / NRRL 15099 / SCC 1413) TaxID=219305 RepID=UPI0002E3011C|nr:helix-turn-helix domain-containing protein [Micromonospora sp. ATCC 39149]
MISRQNDPQPTDLGDVRVANRAVVLRHVRVHAPCSRADIAARTGLNKATVSSLVTELIERRLVRETGLTEHRVGRPATMLVLDGEPYAALGLQIGADELVAVAVDLGGNRLLTWRRAFAAAAATPAETVRALAGPGPPGHRPGHQRGADPARPDRRGAGPGRRGRLRAPGPRARLARRPPRRPASRRAA